MPNIPNSKSSSRPKKRKLSNVVKLKSQDKENTNFSDDDKEYAIEEIVDIRPR